MRLQTRVANGVAVGPIPQEPAFDIECTGRPHPSCTLIDRGFSPATPLIKLSQLFIDCRLAPRHALSRPAVNGQ